MLRLLLAMQRPAPAFISINFALPPVVCFAMPQLVHERLSRINACNTTRGWRLFEHRWVDRMATPRLKKHHWRKSWQVRHSSGAGWCEVGGAPDEQREQGWERSRGLCKQSRGKRAGQAPHPANYPSCYIIRHAKRCACMPLPSFCSGLR